MKKHVQVIVCTECNKKQLAIVLHTEPFGTFIHTCVKCKYVIMESEWQEATLEETTNIVNEMNKNSLRTFVDDAKKMCEFLNYVVTHYAKPIRRTYPQIIAMYFRWVHTNNKLKQIKP